jgi:CheY-like chemotaxis protein
MQTTNILLVEDDPEFFLLIREAFGEFGLPINLQVVRDGTELEKFLRELDGQHADLFLDLILLDLNLPGKSGKELLRELKADQKWQIVPVIILSGSTAAHDAAQCIDLGASDFISKPGDYFGLLDTVSQIIQSMFPELIDA